MKKILQTSAALILSLFFIVISPVDHVSAIKSTMASNHGTTSNTLDHCKTFCKNTQAKNNEDIESPDDEDDEPTPPYYLQFESTRTDYVLKKHTAQKIPEESEDTPKYRLCCVIRR